MLYQIIKNIKLKKNPVSKIQAVSSPSLEVFFSFRIDSFHHKNTLTLRTCNTNCSNHYLPFSLSQDHYLYHWENSSFEKPLQFNKHWKSLFLTHTLSFWCWARVEERIAMKGIFLHPSSLTAIIMHLVWKPTSCLLDTQMELDYATLIFWNSKMPQKHAETLLHNSWKISCFPKQTLSSYLEFKIP